MEDNRNILIISPKKSLGKEAMATLQAALKRSIEQLFQIEEAELAVEPLPLEQDRKHILFYEAAEGGAGVLTRLVNNPGEFAMVAKNALKILHYNFPENVSSIDDLENSEIDSSSLVCGVCYRCILSLL